MKRRIIISVTDKRNLEQFKRLTDLGWEIISTGGTYDKLQEFGIPCIKVEAVTGFPEMMGGRLKTLHPNVFGGILADRSIPEHMEAIAEHNIEPIDLVVVNLYDFESNPGIEKIDIGGPSMIRAAAKNGKHTVSVVDPDDYEMVISEIEKYGEVSLDTKKQMFIKVFEYTSSYDDQIINHFIGKLERDEPFF